MSLPFTEKEDGVMLKIDVSPNSRNFEVLGANEWNNTLKVKVKSPPEKGKANAELAMELSKKFSAKAEILSGEHCGKKTILLRGNPKEISKKIFSSLQ